MTIWLVEPHDSVIARDGRPFGADVGARAHSLSFVTPSMMAGAVRQRIGSDARGVFVHQKPDELLQHAIRGPLLYELTAGLNTEKPWVMAPSDALLMGDGSTLHMRRLEPIADARGCTNLPVKDPAHPAIAAEGLMPVGISPRGNASDDRSKPNESDGIYWHWDFFAKWLSNPVDNSPVPPSAIMGALPRDVRTHVQIDASTGTVGDEGGKLFSTQGLNFRRQGRRFGIGVDVSSEIPNQPMVGSLGGERRLVSWHLSEGKFPALSEDLVKTIVSRKHCRVILLTPAYFTQGWYPELLLARNYNVQPTLLAAATGRAQILSGWDMAKGRPKPSTRYMGAGSVFYLKLAGSDADITTWVNKVWFQNISDQEQSQRDGFGLAVVGAW